MVQLSHRLACIHRLAEIRAGYGKSMSTGFGGVFGSLALVFVMAVSGILPFIGSIAGSAIATASLLMVIASRLVSAISSRSLLIDALLTSHLCTSLYLLA